MLLSAPLSALLDNEVKVSAELCNFRNSRVNLLVVKLQSDQLKQLSRPQTVKRIWAYIREHDLQDPKDKRMIICDDSMRAIFRIDKIHMFTMNKILNQNLYNPDE